MKTICALFVLCTLSIPAVQAATFKCVDTKGRTIFSDRKCSLDAVLVSRPILTAAQGNTLNQGAPRPGMQAPPATMQR